jgi:hypothetical protein
MTHLLAIGLPTPRVRAHTHWSQPLFSTRVTRFHACKTSSCERGSGVPGVRPSVRRAKGVGLQWVQLPPDNWVAPVSSYRSGGGGNETVGAFETHVSLRRCSEQAGRNASERRAGLETSNVSADLALVWGRPPPLASMETVGIDRPTSDPTQRATGVMTTACLYTEIQRNTGNPEW